MTKLKKNELLFELNENNFTAKIIGCFSNNPQIIIPRSINNCGRDYIITRIEKDSFKSNKCIKKIQFSKNSELSAISKGAFTESSLTNLSLPPNLEKLEEGWCKCTSELTHISLSPQNRHFAILKDDFLLSKSDPKSDTFDVLLFSRRDIEKVVIPSTIKYISSYCFYECEKLHSIEFSENSMLVSIGKYAFSSTSIGEITIPSSVTSIGKFCFAFCNKLKTINFSENSKLYTIEKGTFLLSKNLNRISIPSSVTEIKEQAFQHCKSLEVVEFKDDSEIRSIGQNAFLSTKINSIFFPQKLNHLENGWCNAVPNLKTFSISPYNRYFSPYKEDFILSKSDQESTKFDVIVFVNRSIQKVVIPPFIKRIESFAFSGCYGLSMIEFVENSHLESIGQYAFSSCSFCEIKIPSKVQAIENGTFSGCASLKFVTFSDDSQIRSIGDVAFFNSALQSLSIPPNLEYLSNKWCLSTKNLVNFSISPLNSNFLNYQNKFILGKSDKNSNIFDVVVFAVRNIERPFIPSNIKSIGSCSFYECNQIQSIQFQRDSNLLKIEDQSFSTSSIQSITIPSKVREIGKIAFLYCNLLKTVEFEQNSELELIGQNAFYETDIQNLRIPEKTKEISNGSFSNCRNLKCIEILGEEISLGNNCFNFIHKYSIISMPNSEKVCIHQNSFSKKSILSILYIKSGTKIKISLCDK